MKRAILTIGFAIAAVTSNAAYLLWQVEDAYTATVRDKSGDSCYNYVTLSASDGSTKTELMTVSREASNEGSFKVDLSTLKENTTYSIFVELMNYKDGCWNQVGVTVDEQLSYCSTATSGNTYIDFGNTAAQPQIWHGGTIDVPEPTSGMMVMMGFAFLALRRCKV